MWESRESKVFPVIRFDSATTRDFGDMKIETQKNIKWQSSDLKKKSTYWVKVRAYKIVDGKRKYGAWSKIKKVKIKK